MKILVTGANGFMGKNLVAALKNIRDGKDKRFALDADIVVWDNIPPILDLLRRQRKGLCLTLKNKRRGAKICQADFFRESFIR